MRRAIGFFAVLAVTFGTFAAQAVAEHRKFANMSLEFSDPNTAITSDIAFWGNTAFVGNYDGVRTYNISDPASPTRLADFSCPGPQNDPSVWDTSGDGTADLMVLSVDRTMAGPECGAAPAAHDDPNGWEGIRLFDVSNPAAPQHIRSIYLDCGSHTNTMYLDEARNRLVVLVSSYPLRPGPTCGPIRGPEANRDPLHGVIQTVFIPLMGNPQDSANAATEGPELPIDYPGDPDNKFLPSEHGLTGPDLVDGMRACHDIAVFVPLKLVAGACAEQSQLWRIDDATGLPDTSNPVWVFDQPNIDFHHSATFSWDGKVTNIIDESFGSGCPTMTPGVGQTGRMFFLNTTTGSRLSTFMIPRSQEKETPDYCSAHLGNVVPASDRYLLVNAWYTGGVDVIDFSNPRAPREVAYFDDNGDEWSGYWYERPGAATGPLNVFGTHGVEHVAHGGGLENDARGLESFLASVSADRVGLDHLNPQVQEQVIPAGISEARRTAGAPKSSSPSRRASGRVSRGKVLRRLAP
jgi:hypothetical protein